MILFRNDNTLMWIFFGACLFGVGVALGFGCCAVQEFVADLFYTLVDAMEF